MVLLTLGDEVFLVVPLRRRKRVAYDGDDAIVLSLYDWMMGCLRKHWAFNFQARSNLEIVCGETWPNKKGLDEEP